MRPCPLARPVALLAALLSFAACSKDQPEDPLEPGAVEDAAKAEGDGEGSSHSGYYGFITQPTACDCTGDAIDLCGGAFSSLTDLSGGYNVQQVDGYLTISPTDMFGDAVLSGSIDADDTFALGAIYDSSGVVAELTVYARMDGGFDAPGKLHGKLIFRVVGTLNADEVDCRAEADVDGERYS